MNKANHSASLISVYEPYTVNVHGVTFNHLTVKCLYAILSISFVKSFMLLLGSSCGNLL